MLPRSSKPVLVQVLARHSEWQSAPPIPAPDTGSPVSAAPPADAHSATATGWHAPPTGTMQPLVPVAVCHAPISNSASCCTARWSQQLSSLSTTHFNIHVSLLQATPAQFTVQTHSIRNTALTLRRKTRLNTTHVLLAPQCQGTAAASRGSSVHCYKAEALCA